MSESNVATKSTGGYTPGVERRKRKPDVWSRVLRYLALLVYPVVILNLFIFMSVSGEQQKALMMGKIGPSAAEQVSTWVKIYAFLPIMAGGLVIGVTGLFLSRKRTRRRYDYKFQNQLILVVLSVVGLFIYLFFVS